MIRTTDAVTGKSTNKNLGVFDTEAEAFQAYCVAKEQKRRKVFPAAA